VFVSCAGKLVLNILIVPVFLTVACFLYYANERKNITRLIREGVAHEDSLKSGQAQLRRNLYFLTFLLCARTHACQIEIVRKVMPEAAAHACAQIR
jgi:hypothetical protein